MAKRNTSAVRLGYMASTLTDEAAAFCEAEWPRVVRVLWLHCGDIDIAEDSAQEAFARAIERWETVRAMDRPEHWVLRVALNFVTSVFRRRKVERRIHGIIAASGSDAPDSVELVDVEGVRAAILRLPPRQRAAFLLRHESGLPVREAAKVLGCAEGTVQALTFQAVRRLRELVPADAREGEIHGH